MSNILSLGLLLQGLLLQQENPTPANWPTLKITSLGDSYHTVDLIPLSIRLSNPSSVAIPLRRQFAVGALQIFFKSTGDKEFVKGVFLAGEECLTGGVQPELAANQSIDLIAFLSPGLARASCFKLPESGSIEIKATFPHGNGELTSSTISLTLKPSDSLEVNTREFFGSETFHTFVLRKGGTGQSQTDKQCCDQLYRISGTDYQRALLSLMAGACFQRGFEVEGIGEARDPQTGRVTGYGKYVTNVPNYPAAIAAYGGAAKTTVAALRTHATVGLAECYLATKDYTAAKKCILLAQDDARDNDTQARLLNVTRKMHALQQEEADAHKED
jgi:hypothetical protein